MYFGKIEVEIMAKPRLLQLEPKRGKAQVLNHLLKPGIMHPQAQKITTVQNNAMAAAPHLGILRNHLRREQKSLRRKQT